MSTGGHEALRACVNCWQMASEPLTRFLERYKSAYDLAMYNDLLDDRGVTSEVLVVGFMAGLDSVYDTFKQQIITARTLTISRRTARTRM